MKLDWVCLLSQATDSLRAAVIFFFSDHSVYLKMKTFGIYIALTLLAAAPPVAADGCYLDQSLGAPLPFPAHPELGMCSRGFYCPNSNFTNRSTYPRYCPPTPQCLKTRQESNFCPPQGPYEPQVCAAGFYCPTSYLQLPCPAGHWCYYGMSEPQECPGLAYCPSGTVVPYDYSGLLVVILLDIGLLIFVFVIYRRRIFSPKPTFPTDENGGWSSMTVDEQSVVIRGMTESRGEMMPVDIVCDNLSLRIPSEDGKPEKVLLSGVTAHIQPGRLTAIMGPSGAGKTVLLSTILGKLPENWKSSGSLLVNGLPSIKEFRHIVGYVPQDDVVHRELTVFENISFHAELRLDRSWPADLRTEFTSGVIKALGIQGAADVHVGDSETAGISGGQRKRTSVALELVSAPACLFLDEPTTGLDSFTALELCRILKSLATSANLTVVMVVHQPRVEIWRELDQILLLAPGGQTVYEGAAASAAETYFHDRLGFDFSSGNPADIILDGISSQRELCIAEWEKFVAERNHNDQGRGSSLQTASPLRTFGAPKLHAASFWRQVLLFHRRSVMKQAYQFTWLVQDIVLSVILAAFMASAAVKQQTMGVLAAPYTAINPKPSIGTVPMLGMYYGIAIAAVVPATAIRPFGTERRQYWHEASTGTVNRLAYFIGTTTAQIYRLVLTSLHFTVVVYFMWNPLVGFAEFFVVLLLSFACTDAQSVALASFIKPRNAPILTSVASVFIALFNGYPQIPFIGIAAHSWYMTEGIYTKSLEPIAYLWDLNDTMNNVFGYVYGRFSTDVQAMCAILVCYYAISFVLLVTLQRSRQQ